MSKLQVILITILSAILFQVASALAVFSADDLTDVRRWFVGVLVGVANAVGVAIVALYTTGGISLPRPPTGGAAGGSSGSGGGSPGGGSGGGLAIVWDDEAFMAGIMRSLEESDRGVRGRSLDEIDRELAAGRWAVPRAPA